MNIPCTAPAFLVAGLAVAVLLPVSFGRTGEAAAEARVPTVPAVDPARPAPPACVCSAFNPGASRSISSFPVFARDSGSTCCAQRPLLFIDYARTHPLNPGILGAPETNSTVAPQEIEPARPGMASAATTGQAARDEAELNEMFAVAPRADPARAEAGKNGQGERGKQVYLKLCYACHQPDGRGLPGTFPMLAQSDFLAADRQRAIRIVLGGLAGPVTVNGQTINSAMPALKTELTDQEIADVLTYVFNAWENPGGAFTPDQVAAIRNGEEKK